MKKLYILRHAKSSWDNPILADFERPLNERGTKTAELLGKFMAKNEYLPNLIVGSPAARAKETAIIVKRSGNLPADIRFEENIYEAELQTLVQIVSDLDEQMQSVMIVGHNPGLENLVKFLTGEIQAMPTAALAVIDLDIANWKDVTAECGTLFKLVRPKTELKEFSDL